MDVSAADFTLYPFTLVPLFMEKVCHAICFCRNYKSVQFGRPGYVNEEHFFINYFPLSLPTVRLSVRWSVGWSVDAPLLFHSFLEGEKLHFSAPERALV